MVKNIKFYKIPILAAVLFLFLLPGCKARAAILFQESPNKALVEQQNFVSNWYLDTAGESVNALSLKIKFSQDALKATDLSAADSSVRFWVQAPAFSNERGEITMIGGIPNGFKGSKIPLFKVNFQPKTWGKAEISLEPGSELLKNDGKGSAALLQFKNIEFIIAPKSSVSLAQIYSPTHPDQNKWYQAHDVMINFNTRADKSYSYSFSPFVNVEPDNKPSKIIGRVLFQNIPDGVYYFKLNALDQTSKAWKNSGIFLVRIDSTPPEQFDPLIRESSSIFAGKPFLSFSSVDKTSGVGSYQVKNGLLGSFQAATSPLLLSKSLVGDNLEIIAIDNAGNVRKETVPYQGLISEEIFYIILSGAALLIIIIWELVKKQQAK